LTEFRKEHQIWEKGYQIQGKEVTTIERHGREDALPDQVQAAEVLLVQSWSSSHTADQPMRSTGTKKTRRIRHL
jgi:hypothetical protein